MAIVKIVPMPGPVGNTGPQGPAGGGGNSVPQTWTATNESLYEIYQVHGGIEVSTESYVENPTYSSYAPFVQENTNVIRLQLDNNTEFLLIPMYVGSVYNRRLYIPLNGIDYNVESFYPEGPGTWVFILDKPVSVYTETTYTLILTYGGAPVVWWDADTLGIHDENHYLFRGAKIDYHAYSTDSGTIIGTIYIAHDSGDHNVTHIETNSGSGDLGSISLWKRDASSYNNERKLFVYRTDGEQSTTKIHWTAQVYYAPEYYD